MIQKSKFHLKAIAAATACLAQTIFCGTAYAQQASPNTTAVANAAQEVSEITVTGTRMRGGFQTPTPVAAITASELKNAAPGNLADGLNQLPVFNGSIRTSIPSTSAATGTAGQNLLNLRRLGPQETLILLDGRRLSANNAVGSVDINTLPQALVERVDVVTGGASAAYGSDAVAGVVNFVLNKNFEGFKGEIQRGISTYHDLSNGSISLAFGKKLLDGRLHVIGSFESFRQHGIGLEQDTHRGWYEAQWSQLPNPTAGAIPSILVVPDLRSSLGSYGGLISSGPLKGTQFLPGGATAPFNYGTITGSSFQSGGDGAQLHTGFAPFQERTFGFVHANFDVTDSLTLFAEATVGYAHTDAATFNNPFLGTAAFTIFRDNAYLPAAVLTRMIAANVQSIPVGRTMKDFPTSNLVLKSPIRRGALGLKGDLSDHWSYDASVSYGSAKQNLSQTNQTRRRNLYAAADAVVNPANGQIVCRSTLAGLDPGCVPLNIFGFGSPSEAAINYIIADSSKFLTLKQKVAAANLRGELDERFSLGAGPIGVATGVEYREESAHQTVDQYSPLINNYTGIRGGPGVSSGIQGSFPFFNPLPLDGKFNVKEAYLETGLPLLKNLPFVQALDATAAVRRADYSNSGPVTTWKAGLNYAINNQVRLRFTRSRDIRGPNILELYNTATQINNNSIYKGVTTPTLTINSGNPDLKPEKALTTTYGFVVRPSWLEGVDVSLDYYDIKIVDVIGARTSQRTIDECLAGNVVSCSYITVTSSNTLIFRAPSENLSFSRVAGYDFELGYRTKLYDGNLSVRLLASHSIKDYSQAVGAPAVSVLGQPVSPRWKGTLQATYTNANWSFFVQQQYIDKVLFDANRVEGIDTSLNTAQSINYTNIRGAYKFKMLNGQYEAYLAISNLFNRAPPLVTGNPTSFVNPPNAAYDTFGRYFTAGLRFNY